MSNKKNILIAGVIRDGANTIRQELEQLRNSFDRFKNIYYLIIESDSEDDTVEKLAEIQKEFSNFQYKSVSNLTRKIKLRTDRIAFCRNIYLQEVEKNPLYLDIDYVVIADLDGVNNLITRDAVDSCFIRDDWDVCTANQSGNYYDIWALRHDLWCPNDCWEQLRFLTKLQDAENSRDLLNLEYAAVYSKMIRIPKNSDWISVDSSFGGLAIYKKRVLIGERYIGSTKEGFEICEHISLNLGITGKGFKIFINPSLINTDYTNHSISFKPKANRTLYI